MTIAILVMIEMSEPSVMVVPCDTYAGGVSNMSNNV